MFVDGVSKLHTEVLNKRFPAQNPSVSGVCECELHYGH